MKIIQSKVIAIFLFLVFGSALIVHSQSNLNMLLPLIEGNQYELKKYDKKGRLESYKIIKISKIRRDNQEFELEIITYNYNKESTLKDSVQTRLECGKSAENMVMSVLAFLGNSGDGNVRLEITSDEELFPTELSKDMNLKDVRMNIKVQQGALSFFGAKTKIAIRNRKLTMIDSPDVPEGEANGYNLTGKMLIKAYMLGINLKSAIYDIKEVVEIDKGLVRQVIKQANGSYFDLRLING
jgi:hypothetical protein